MKIDNIEEKVITVIMAAGKGTRMKSDKSKLVQKIYDKELVKRVTDVAKKIGSDEVIAVVGHLREQVQEALGDTVEYAYQEELLGTGHAVMQAEEYLKGKDGKVLILYGDVPITRPETLKNLVKKSVENKEYATLLTAIYENPTGYGRIIRDVGGNIKGIVEEKDADEMQKEIKEINSGIYVFDIKELLLALKKIKPNNAQGEYYLTDVIKIMNDKGLKTGAVIVVDNTEILGVNDRTQLELLTRVLRMRINTEHMKNGVTIEDSNCTYIYDDVEIGKGTNIGCGTITCNYDGKEKHKTKIGNNCFIGSNVNLVAPVIIADNSVIGAGSTITEDVPKDTLSIAREKQVNKKDYYKNK